MGETVPTAGSEADQDLMPDFTFEQLFAEIQQSYGMPPLAPDEFTITMYRKRTGCKQRAATTALQRAVESGVLEYVGYRLVGGHPSQAWRPKRP